MWRHRACCIPGERGGPAGSPGYHCNIVHAETCLTRETSDCTRKQSYVEMCKYKSKALDSCPKTKFAMLRIWCKWYFPLRFLPCPPLMLACANPFLVGIEGKIVSTESHTKGSRWEFVLPAANSLLAANILALANPEVKNLEANDSATQASGAMTGSLWGISGVFQI